MMVRNTAQKVIWAEGILLGQQHFQQWDKQQQACHTWLCQNLSAFLWGISNLEIDETALDDGRFAIKLCSAAYPNGQIIEYDAKYDKLLNCALIVPPSGTKKEIYLVVANNDLVHGITGYETSGSNTAWLADYKEIVDIYDDKRKREILFGKLNLQLLQEHELHGNVQCLKIVQLNYLGDNKYSLDKKYIPPLLHLQGSITLKENLQQLLRIMQNKISFLQTGNTSDIKGVLATQILIKHYVTLQHLLKNQQTHPVVLFDTLLELYGGLGVFNSHFSTTELPEYKHEALTDSFTTLTNVLTTAFATIIPDRAAALQLRRENNSLYILDTITDKQLQELDLFIAVYLQSEDNKWIDQFAKQAKVGPLNTIEKLMVSALSGVRVSHVQRPPSKLTLKLGFEYFHLEKIGEFWQQIKAEKNLALFIPSYFANAKIELVGVKNGNDEN